MLWTSRLNNFGKGELRANVLSGIAISRDQVLTYVFVLICLLSKQLSHVCLAAARHKHLTCGIQVIPMLGLLAKDMCTMHHIQPAPVTLASHEKQGEKVSLAS